MQSRPIATELSIAYFFKVGSPSSAPIIELHLCKGLHCNVTHVDSTLDANYVKRPWNCYLDH